MNLCARRQVLLPADGSAVAAMLLRGVREEEGEAEGGEEQELGGGGHGGELGRGEEDELGGGESTFLDARDGARFLQHMSTTDTDVGKQPGRA